MPKGRAPVGTVATRLLSAVANSDTWSLSRSAEASRLPSGDSASPEGEAPVFSSAMRAPVSGATTKIRPAYQSATYKGLPEGWTAMPSGPPSSAMRRSTAGGSVASTVTKAPSGLLT